jgi:putative oxidoreductase
MKTATIITRSLLGLVFLVFGANKFLNFMPLPPMQGMAAQFMVAMFATHFIYIVATFEIVGGLLLLTGRYAPLGLTLVGPVVVNILAFHTFMNPAGLPVAVVVSAIALFLLYSYRANFAALVKQAITAKTESTVQVAKAVLQNG